MGTMTLEELYAALHKDITDQKLNFDQLAGRSFGFSMVANELPFAQGISLAGVTLTPVNNGEFSLTGTGAWELLDGVGAAVTFQSEQDGIAAQLTLTMPPSFSISIPHVDWLALTQISLAMQASPGALKTPASPIGYPVSGALSAIIALGGTSLPIKISLDGSAWTVTGDFDKVDFPSLSDLLSFVGNTAGINLPDGLNDLAKVSLYDVSLPFDPVNGSIDSVGVTFGSTPGVNGGWEVVPGVFKISDDKISISVVNPTDSASRAIAGSIGATLTIGGAAIVISAAHADSGGWNFQGRTTTDQQLDAGALFDDLAGKLGITLPGSLKKLTLKNLLLEFNTQTENIQSTFTLDWDLANKPIELQTVLKATRQGGTYSPDIKGTLLVGGSTFIVTFQDSSMTGHWTAATSGQPLHLSELAAAFGMEDDFSSHPPWDLVLTAVSFSYDSTAGKLELDIAGTMTLAGIGIPFDLTDKSGTWLLEGKTTENQVIDFTQLVAELFNSFGLTLPGHLPAFALKNLDLKYDFKTGNARFLGESTQPSPLQLGNQTHNVDTRLDLTIATDTAGTRIYTGYLRGSITIGSAVFTGAYDFGEATVLKATWHGGGSLGYADLAAAHGIEHTLQVPGGLPLDITRAAFEYDVAKGRFLLSADSKYGEAFFIASNANQTWDFAFGILIDTADIPGFPNLGFLSLTDTMLVLSTVKDDSFIVPTLPALPAPGQLGAARPRTFPTIGTTQMHLKPGVSLAALLELEGNGSNAVLKNLHSVVGQSELLIQTSVSDLSQISFQADLDGGLSIAGAGSDKLVLSDAYVQLTDSTSALSVLVAGSVMIPFNHVTLQASGAMAISDTSMQAIFQIAAGVDGKPKPIPSPFGLAGVELDKLSIEVGVEFEPPGVDLGLEGSFNITGQEVDANDFTIVMELEGEIPNPVYLSTHIQSLTIAKAITALTGLVVSDAPPVITAIKAEDVAMYWSESAGTVLPDGTLSQAGFGFNGLLTISGFSCHGALAVSTATGVSGDAEMSPLHLGSVFSLTGEGKGVTVKQALINGQWESLAKPLEPGDTLETRDFLIIPPGGATIAFNSKKSPFLDVSAKASLFNFLNADVEIEIRDDGFNWKQTESIGSLVSIEFDCAVSKSGFSSHAEFDINIKGDVGPIEILGIDFGTLHLDISFDATLDIAVDAGGFLLKASGKFDFEGIRLTMPELTIKENFKSFEELPAAILKQIEDEANTIFEDVFDEAKQLLADAEKEAEAIVDDAEKEAKAIAAGAEATAAKVIAGANDAYEAAKRGVDAAQAEVVKIDADVVKIGEAAESEVEDIAGKAATEAKAIGAEADKVLADANTAIKNIETAIGNEITSIKNAAAAALSTAEADVIAIAAAAKADVEKIGEWAKAAGDAIVNEATQIANQIGAEVVRIAEEIADKLKEAAEWLERQAEAAWHAVSKY